jgi:hypothetical protein
MSASRGWLDELVDEGGDPKPSATSSTPAHIIRTRSASTISILADRLRPSGAINGHRQRRDNLLYSQITIDPQAEQIETA